MLLVTIDLASESLPYFLAFQATVMKFEPYIQFLDITSTVNLNELKHYFFNYFFVQWHCFWVSGEQESATWPACL